MNYEDITDQSDAYRCLHQEEAKMATPDKVHALLKYFETPDSWMYIAERTRTPLPPEYECRIAESPSLAFRYALNVLGAPFSAGEAALATDIHYGLLYATRVKGRFPQFETHLCQYGTPQQIFDYAVELGERFPQGEPVLLQHSEYACLYACEVLHGEWPEAEPVILLNLAEAAFYTVRARNRRWEAVEAYLFDTDLKGCPRHLSDALMYANVFELTLPPALHEALYECAYLATCQIDEVLPYVLRHHMLLESLEQYMSTEIEMSLKYVEQISRRRWKKMEPPLAKHVGHVVRYAQATNQVFVLGEQHIFARPAQAKEYYERLCATTHYPERDTSLLLAAGYAQHSEVKALFQKRGLCYATLWPLWESMALSPTERRELITSLLPSEHAQQRTSVVDTSPLRWSMLNF